jgi:Nuclease-related domain
VPAADGVDARARRVAARLLPARARRSAIGRAGADDPARAGASGARHRPRPTDVGSVPRTMRTLEQDGWVVLSQVQPPGRSSPAIDHIAIGPGGVVVIDSRHWVGRIEVTRGVVQQNGFWREQECVAVARTAGSVAALLLPQHRTAVHAMVCVVQHELAEHLVSPGVHVVGVNELGRALRALPYRLHPSEVSHLYAVLSRILMGAEPPDQLTTAELDEPAGSGQPVGAHREAIDPVALAPLFVPIAGRSLRDAARGAPRRRWWWWAGRRPATPWGPAAKWPAGKVGAAATNRWWGRRNVRLMAARTLLALLVAIAALLLGPGLVHGLTTDQRPEAPSLPVGPVVGSPTVAPGAGEPVVSDSAASGAAASGPAASGAAASGPAASGAAASGPAASGPAASGAAVPPAAAQLPRHPVGSGPPASTP